MLKPIQRIITPAGDIQQKSANLLGQIKSLFTAGSMVTLIVRNPNVSNADMIITEENDFDNLIAAIHQLKLQRQKGAQ